MDLNHLTDTQGILLSWAILVALAAVAFVAHLVFTWLGIDEG